MNDMLRYGVIAVLLVLIELCYFLLADKFNIIDKPNERSSHSKVVLRGGGIIFLLGAWIWCAFFGCNYLWFMVALTIAAGVSFVDDIVSLPDSVRLLCQFSAMAVMFYQLDMLHVDMWWIVLLALIVYVGASNVINFMDGINGITGGYAMASLIPLFLLNRELAFIDESLIVVIALADLVFCYFNFRPRGKAKCFAGDAGSMSIAFILLFMIGRLIMKTGDVTYLIFLLVYGVDGCLTICHRIMLHENLGKAHRKHAYQLMANELKMSHITVSLLYLVLQLVISLVSVFLIPDTLPAHLVYLFTVTVLLSIAYIVFMKRYYHLHEEYLASLERT
ncbi:MAG: glycosyltransferase family 4 protein [Bacteroidales bacterium]|nr:glycosyltransferase family 4 protein [Bacteroidales bacterium]